MLVLLPFCYPLLVGTIVMRKINIFVVVLFILFVSVVLLASCTDYDYRLSKLPTRELTYEKLPKEVQASLAVSDYDSICFAINAKQLLMLVDSNDYNKYKYETVVFGPWIVYNKIIDTQKANVYRVEQGTPHPYIIYKGKLYLANDFNFILYHYKEVKYTEYELK